MKYSDLIVPHGAENDIAIQFISENLKNKLLSRGVLIQTPKELRRKENFSQFRIMFDVVDDVLITYKQYSGQIYSIKDKFKAEMSQRQTSEGGFSDSDRDQLIQVLEKELEILRT